MANVWHIQLIIIVSRILWEQSTLHIIDSPLKTIQSLTFHEDIIKLVLLNTLKLRLNGRHFADDIFKCIFLNENVWIPSNISLKFDPQGPINNIPALVQIMAWRRPGDKPLSGPMIDYQRIYASLGLNELKGVLLNNFSKGQMILLEGVVVDHAMALSSW